MTPLKKSTLFYYSLADLPVAMALFPVMVFIPRYYSHDLGIPLATLAAVMLVSCFLYCARYKSYLYCIVMDIVLHDMLNK